MTIPNTFQYSWPDKEFRPESHAHVLFYHCLYIRNNHHSGQRLYEAVRSFFMLNTRAPIDVSKVPSRIDMPCRLSGTHHK